MSTNVKCYYEKNYRMEKEKKKEKKSQVRTWATVGATCAARER